MIPEYKTLSRIFASFLFSFLAMHVASAQDSMATDRAAFKAAFDSCLTSAGIERPEPGERPQAPSDEERQLVDSCLQEKGFQPPTHRGGPRGEGRRDRAAQNGFQ